MTKPDQDLMTASAAVAAAFEWEKVATPRPVARAAKIVLRAVSTGGMIAAGYELAEQVGRAAWLQLDPQYRAALDATDEFLARIGFELDVELYSTCDRDPIEDDAGESTVRLARRRRGESIGSRGTDPSRR